MWYTILCDLCPSVHIPFRHVKFKFSELRITLLCYNTQYLCSEWTSDEKNTLICSLIKTRIFAEFDEMVLNLIQRSSEVQTDGFILFIFITI